LSELPAPAVGILELCSVATGIAVADAMVKAAPVADVRSGTVQPGRYLVLVAGDTASVEVALEMGTARAGATLTGRVFLADIHPQVVAALVDDSWHAEPEPEALGIVETASVPPIVDAADAGVKAADVDVAALVLADGLGGKGYVLFGGPIADVEAATEAAVERAERSGTEVRIEIIAQLHPEVRANLVADLRFNQRLAARGTEA